MATKKWILISRFRLKTTWLGSKLGKCWPHYEMKVISGPLYKKINFHPSGTSKIYFPAEIEKKSIFLQNAQISKWTRFSSFCRISAKWKYVGSEYAFFRKREKNHIFGHFVVHNPSISEKWHQKVDDRIFDFCCYFDFRMAKFTKSLSFSKVSDFTSIILHYGQNPPETR